jgi:hypothetical protein
MLPAEGAGVRVGGGRATNPALEEAPCHPIADLDARHVGTDFDHPAGAVA